MARTRKDAGSTVDTRNGRRAELAPVMGERFDLPADLGRRMLKQTIAAWDAYWADPVSQLRTPTDRPVLLRWIENLDRLTRLQRAADSQPLLTTSQGQSANPLYQVALKLAAEVRHDEAQLGVGPLHRSRLGISVLSERKTLVDLNAAYVDLAPEPSGPDPRMDRDA